MVIMMTMIITAPEIMTTWRPTDMMYPISIYYSLVEGSLSPPLWLVYILL